jgi:hypothetical protein
MLSGTIDALGVSLPVERTEAGAVVDGYFAPGPAQTVLLTAIVTPNGTDSDGNAVVQVHANGPLYAETRHGSQGPRVDADRFRWHGHRYRITQVDDWSQLGFYVAQAVRE